MKFYDMKTILLLLLSLIIAVGCKKTSPPNWDETQKFTVEGYMYSSVSKMPLVNVGVSLSQVIAPRDTDPYAFTDSTGHFAIVYQANQQNEGITLNMYLPSYKCVYSSISFLERLPKGQNLNVGKIYTSMYGN